MNLLGFVYSSSGPVHGRIARRICVAAARSASMLKMALARRQIRAAGSIPAGYQERLQPRKLLEPNGLNKLVIPQTMPILNWAYRGYLKKLEWLGETHYVVVAC